MNRSFIRRWNFGIAVCVTLFIIAPYVIGWMSAGEGIQFNGFLLNPIDGNSYLAKMEEGRQGSWLYHFRNSPENVKGAPYYFFYMLLGHIARVVNLDTILIFHIARVLFAWLLMFILHRVVIELHPDEPWLAIFTFAWLTISGGMGWLLIGGSSLPADLWVAEAYPFLSMYSNPHFPAAMFLMVATLLAFSKLASKGSLFLLGIISLLLSLIYPFGVIVVIFSLGLWTLWNIIEHRPVPWLKVFSFSLPGGIWSVGQYAYALQDPFLSQWNSQNISLTGSLGGFLLSFSPGLILALVAIIWIKPWRVSDLIKLIVCWFIVATLIGFVPSSSQRRFLIGLQIPVLFLASICVQKFASLRIGNRIWIFILFLLSLPSVILILTGSIEGSLSRSASLYINQDTVHAIKWLETHSEPDDIILASKKNGVYIPALINRRVVYGHPIETINADERYQLVQDVFTGKRSHLSEVMSEFPIRYILVDSNDVVNLSDLDEKQFTLVGDWNGVKVYEVMR